MAVRNVLLAEVLRRSSRPGSKQRLSAISRQRLLSRLCYPLAMSESFFFGCSLGHMLQNMLPLKERGFESQETKTLWL